MHHKLLEYTEKFLNVVCAYLGYPNKAQKISRFFSAVCDSEVFSEPLWFAVMQYFLW